MSAKSKKQLHERDDNDDSATDTVKGKFSSTSSLALSESQGFLTTQLQKFLK